MKKTSFFGSLIGCTALVAICVSAANGQDTATWNGGTGNWNDAGQWDGGVVPDNGATTYDVLIDGSNPVDSIVNLNQDATIDNLTISSGDTLNITSGNSLNTVGGAIVNNGTLNIAGSFSNSSLIVSDGTLLNGSGLFHLDHANRAIIASKNDGDLLTFGVNVTVDGKGKVGNELSTIVNNGRIDANDATGGLLTIAPGTGGFDNNSTIRASGGGVLRLDGGDFDNSGGMIEAKNDSVVELSANVSGGTLSSSGSGFMRVNSGDSASLNGTVSNDATIEVAGTFGNSTLSMGDGTVLDGSGRIQLKHSNRARINAVVAGDVLTNGANHTIGGAGNLGLDDLGVINNGTVEAKMEPNGDKLTIDPDSATGFVNNGSLRAVDGGILRLSDGEFNNTNGTIEAQDTGVVELAGDVSGGTLTSSGDGFMRVNSGDAASLNGTVSNDATIEVAGTFGNSTLSMGDGTVLNGSGRIQLKQSNRARINAVVAGDVLTNGVNHTIGGAGNLGLDDLGIINNGTVEAKMEPNGDRLTIDPDSATGFVNNGSMRAVDGGILRLSDGEFNNTNGTIEAQDTGIVELAGDVSGGTLTSSGSGFMRVNSGDSASLNDNVTNNATVEVDGSFSSSTLSMGDGTVLGGSGRIQLKQSNRARINAVVAGDVLTNGANHTIGGAGNLGLDDLGIINNGTVEAEMEPNGNKLTIDPDAATGFANNGMMRATSDSILRLSDGEFDNTAGVIEAQDLGVVELAASVTGGTLNSSGTGFFRVNSGDDAALNGTVTNNSSMQVSGAFSNSILTIGDSAVLDGSGAIELQNNNRAIITTTLSTDSFTNGANHTIRGNGRIGNGVGNVTNFGTIQADTTNNLMLNPATFQNQGLVLASAGTLTIDNSYTQLGGTTLVDGGTITTSVLMDIQGGSLEGDGLINGDVQLDAFMRPGVDTTLSSRLANNGAAGTLEIDNLTMLGGAISVFELGGLLQGSEFDFLNIDNSLVLDGMLDVSFIDGFASSVLATDSFTIMESAMLTGSFTNIANGGFLDTSDGAGTFQVFYDSGSNSVVLTNFQSASVPEPTAGIVLAIISLMGLKRRRKTDC